MTTPADLSYLRAERIEAAARALYESDFEYEMEMGNGFWQEIAPIALAAADTLAPYGPSSTAVEELVRAASCLLTTANDLIGEAYVQSVDPRCADYMCDRDELMAALDALQVETPA